MMGALGSTRCSSQEVWPRFAARGIRKYPRMGDISARSALTIHRGTAHPSPLARPVLVIGVDLPGAGHAAGLVMGIEDSAAPRSGFYRGGR
jgi:hypothetical protein